MTIGTPSAKGDEQRLQQCEKIIEKGLTAFLNAGSALMEIRENKLYRISFKTFDAYCRERWGIDRTYAHRMIEGVKTVKAIEAHVSPGLLTIGNKISEGVARELKEDPAGVAAEISERAAKGEDAGEVARDIAARKRAEKKAARTPDHPVNNDTYPEQQIAQKTTAPHRAPPLAIDDESLVEELRNAVEDLTSENAKLKADNRNLADKLKLYERDGVAETVKHFEEMAERYKQAEVRESEKMAAWMRTAKWWEKKAKELGYSRNAVIDIETGEEVNG